MAVEGRNDRFNQEHHFDVGEILQTRLLRASPVSTLFLRRVDFDRLSLRLAQSQCQRLIALEKGGTRQKLMEFLRDLPLERDAVGSVSRHQLPSFASPATRSVQCR
jgi:hypothetical protein